MCWICSKKPMVFSLLHRNAVTPPTDLCCLPPWGQDMCS